MSFLSETLNNKRIAKSIGGLSAACVCAACASAADLKPEDMLFISDLDGTQQRYMEILPPDFNADKKYDLIIGLHGHGSDRKQFAADKRDECRAFRDAAAKYGMIAVTPDYRASTSWMGPAAEADMVQLINYLKKKYKSEKIFLVGGSMGGTSALTFSSLHPEMIAGVAALNPLANHMDYKNFQDAIAVSFGGSKDKIPEEYKKRSAEFHADALSMPISITVGGRDTSVPPESALRLAEKLKAMNRKVFLINRPETGHLTNYEDSKAAIDFVIERALENK